MGTVVLGSPAGRTVQWLWAVKRHNRKLEAFALTAEDKTLWHNVEQ